MSSDPVFIPQPDAASNEVIEHRSVRERRGRSDHARLTLNLTTMIDVVFLLLVYFMIATEFKLGEEVYQLDLPRSLQSNQASDPFELDIQPLIINISSSGPGGVNYDIRIDGPIDAHTPQTWDELFTVLRDRQIGDGTIPMFMPDQPIVIKPARTATWNHAMAGFNAAARARYTNMKFALPD